MNNILDTQTDVEILSTEDDKIKMIGNLLWTDSSRTILKLLLETEMTANQIAQKTGMLVSLVIHHLQKMQRAGMIKVNRIEKSSKNHDMKYYGPTKMVVIIFPTRLSDKAKNNRSFLGHLNKIYRFAAIGISGIVSALITNGVKPEYTHGSATGTEPITSMWIPMFVVLLGLTFERVVYGTTFRRIINRFGITHKP